MRLLDVSADTTGSIFSIDDGERTYERLVQVAITGTATVKVQGRLYSDLPWTDILTLSASGAQLIPLYPEVRAVSSGMSGATVKVELDARKRIGS